MPYSDDPYTKAADWLAIPAEFAGRLGGWLLPLLSCVIVYDVVGRKFFDTGSSVLQELEWHIHGAALLLAFGFCYLRDAHVRIDLIRGGLSEPTKLKLEAFGIVVFLLPYMFILSWYGYDFAERALIRNEGSPGGIGLPMRWIIKSLIPIGAALLSLAGISTLFRCFAALRHDASIHDVFVSERSTSGDSK